MVVRLLEEATFNLGRSNRFGFFFVNDFIKQLQAQIMPTQWSDLESHYQRDAVIVVSPVIDLAEAAAVVAEDSKEQLTIWLDEKKIYKPSSEEIKIWESEDQIFNFLIVQPFVLIQIQTNIH